MKRFILALVFGVVVTLLPWILRPLFGDRAAILWLPGFAAISHWFPQGLHSADANTVKAAGCAANAAIWTGVFLLISCSVKIGARSGQIR